jgi:hypothetical protein
VTYKYLPDNELSQGDIIYPVRVITNIVGAEADRPKYKVSTIVIINRNCEISKPVSAANSVLVARIKKLSYESESFQRHIRDEDILNAFYLPSEGRFEEESYVDWRTLQQVNKATLYTLREQRENYKCSLDEEMLKACLGHLWFYLIKPD